MEITQGQKLNAQVIQKAWEDEQFKSNLLSNPVEAMEKLTGHKLNLPEGQKLVVKDQSDESIVYFNIPRKVDIDASELTEEQLELVAGGGCSIKQAGIDTANWIEDNVIDPVSTWWNS